MPKLVTVIGWGATDISQELKRAALLSDSIVLNHMHSQAICNQFPHVLADIAYLKDHGVIDDAPAVSYDVTQHPWLSGYDERILNDPVALTWKPLFTIPPGKRRDLEVTRVLNAATDAYARVAASVLANEEVEPLPLLRTSPKAHPGLPTRKAPVVVAAYEQIPMPSADTPWEAILDWRDDPEAKQKFRRLRAWINEAARQDLTVAELRDQIETRIDDYRAHMAAQHAKIPRERFDAICTAAADVLEELPKIKLSPLLKAVFRPAKLRAELTEMELAAPNREFAYLVGVQDRFARKR